MKTQFYVAKCAGTGCPFKENCERYESGILTKEDLWGTPYNNFTNSCKYYLKKN